VHILKSCLSTSRTYPRAHIKIVSIHLPHLSPSVHIAGWKWWMVIVEGVCCKIYRVRDVRSMMDSRDLICAPIAPYTPRAPVHMICSHDQMFLVPFFCCANLIHVLILIQNQKRDWVCLCKVLLLVNAVGSLMCLFYGLH
jgi:hypothetical protein